jgi:hypothetical protein
MRLKSLSLLVVLALSTAHGQSPAPNPAFHTLDHRKANLVRFDPTVDWQSYKQFRFVPSISATDCLGAEGAAKLTSAFDRTLGSAFHDTAGSSGPVLEIRPVITGVKQTDTLTNAVSFVLIQMPLSYGAASVRYQLVDAESGRQVGEISSQRKAGPWNIPPWEALASFRPLGQTTVLLKSDAKRLRKDINRLARLRVVPSSAGTPAMAEGQ